MRICISIACIFLLGPLAHHKVEADYSRYDSERDELYLDDYGSGDAPEPDDHITPDTHVDHEGSGHGPRVGGPYNGIYDNYDDTEDDDYYDQGDFGDDDVFEGSGSSNNAGGGEWVIDEEEEEEVITNTINVVEEEILVQKDVVVVKESPATTPPPTLTDSDMDSPIQIHNTKTEERQVSIFAQPGILAAFIGGAVVGLLCAILLVMFIVYRMRKKDEGSYPLDEPKRMPLTSSYSPNDKEIYA